MNKRIQHIPIEMTKIEAETLSHLLQEVLTAVHNRRTYDDGNPDLLIPGPVVWPKDNAALGRIKDKLDRGLYPQDY